MIEHAHDLGLPITFFPVNDEADMERLFRLGADGIFTAYPDRAWAIREELRRRGELP